MAESHPAPTPPARSSCACAGPPRAWWREVILVGLLDLLYELTRSLAPTRVDRAFANARTVERLERVLHLNPERFLNEALDRVPTLIPPLSVYYQIGHLVGLLAVLIWAWWFHRGRYRLARNALVVLTLAGLVGYWLVPTAPPRFALSGVVDTIALHPVLLAGQESVVGMVNAYAAMPSLHVAWAVWVGLAVSGLAAGRLRHLAWLHPLATTLVVLATANHYLLDAVAGAVLALLAWSISRAVASHLRRSGGRLRVNGCRRWRWVPCQRSPGPDRPVSPAGVCWCAPVRSEAAPTASAGPTGPAGSARSAGTAECSAPDAGL